MKPHSEFPPRARVSREERRRGRPRGIPWQRVERLAAVGCEEEEIVAALRLPEDALKDPDVRERFRAVSDLGRLQLMARVRHQVMAIATRGTRGKSVVAALALARNVLSWDRPRAERGKERPPNVESAVAELDRVLRRIVNGPNARRCPTCGARQLVLPTTTTN